MCLILFFCSVGQVMELDRRAVAFPFSRFPVFPVSHPLVFDFMNRYRSFLPF